MGTEFISDVLQPLAVLGGIAMIVWASVKAKLEHRKLDMQQQMAEKQSTGHQFDLSFDAALESRVSRLETRSAAVTTLPAEIGQTLRNGQSL